MANGSGRRGLPEGGVMSERDLFIAALQKDDPAERAAYLADASDNDVELRRRVERLLRLHADAGSFLDQPAGEPGETVDPAPGGPDGAPGQADPERTRDEPPPPGEGVGTFIGPYKLMQKLGEGGMGVVWVAEQHEPVKRRVALKVIKPGKAVDDDTLAVGGRGHRPRSTYPLSISSRIPCITPTMKANQNQTPQPSRDKAKITAQVIVTSFVTLVRTAPVLI